MYIQMQITAILTGINVLLLMTIIGLNVRCYKQVCAHYTIFLLIFAGIFLIQNLLQAVFLFTDMDWYVPDVATHALILTALQTAAFTSLLWMELQ